MAPDDPAFRREIRSVYRLGGDDIRRETVALRIVSGTSGDQEKPPGFPNTYLELFQLAQPTNRASFDAANRLWPRPNDPNYLLGTPSVSAASLIRDVFIVFPSAEPFSQRGLAFAPGLVSNDTIYRTPGEYLYSAQHPQSFYRILTTYESSGAAGRTIAGRRADPAGERAAGDRGRPLVRHVDYEIDYDIGRPALSADSLSLRPRRVTLQYEENPLFTSVPTSVAGLTAEWALPYGSLSFTAISQHQRTNFTRPPLGFEPQGSLVAGVSANLGWSLGGLSRALARLLPMVDGDAPSRLSITAELAMSRSRQGGGQPAYVESFEGEGGIGVTLFDSQWQLSSQPAAGSRLARAWLGDARHHPGLDARLPELRHRRRRTPGDVFDPSDRSANHVGRGVGGRLRADPLAHAVPIEYWWPCGRGDGETAVAGPQRAVRAPLAVNPHGLGGRRVGGRPDPG